MKFNDQDHAILARGILVRWNNDLPAAACAWRRLFQNNCTDHQFQQLINQSVTNTPNWIERL